ncbi:MAG: hypothetical protein FWC13_04175 [Oscillospiraceae bacterium]|nr:hypothetical protein [Oscillospiraceae bacterium]
MPLSAISDMNILIATLGAVDAERFISMVKRDTFNYTEWQDNLWQGQSIEAVHEAATKYGRNHA